MKITKIYILGGICGLLAVSSILMTIQSAANGAEMASLQNKEASLMAHQDELQQSLVEALSVSSLQEQSAGLGFTKIGTLVYVTNAGTTASVSEAASVAKLP